MAKIVSISTALPAYRHEQKAILHFMQKAFRLDETDKRKLSFLYSHSKINSRYSVIRDFGFPDEDWQFISMNGKPNVSLNERMDLFREYALPLSVEAVEKCIDGFIKPEEITHLITVSCTGMSAPGLDLQVAEAMQLRSDIFRTSVNFMGCYAAIHALKMAKMICDGSQSAKVVIVATELCTIHFQKDYSIDNAASSLLFADGSAAVLVSNSVEKKGGLNLDHFYSEVAYKGKSDMSWELSNNGFLMTLSSYIPQLIEEDILALVNKALEKSNISREEISHWCLHPGGNKILEVIKQQLELREEDLNYSRKVLSEYGNMSSPTILFVLKEIMENLNEAPAKVFGVAFGPGLTMETFIASTHES